VRRLDPAKLDVLVAAVLLVGTELQVWLGHGGHRVEAAVAGGLVAASVAVRRRYPATVGFAVQGLLAVYATVGWNLPAGFPTVAWFCALYALAIWTGRRAFVAGLVFVALTDLGPEAFWPHKAATVVPFTIGTLAIMILVRRVLGERDRRLALAERERDLAAREAVVEERARIARELHDAIAHNVSMMVVQAGAERRVLPAEGASTREVLETIEEIGRGALTEMRRLVGMLRTDEGGPLAPQPGLRDVELLVSQVRDAGLPVDLQIDGERRELPVGVELSAYRIVQEALTNALKHAGEASASVSIRYTPDSLELEVVDDGAGAGHELPVGGHGLAGMRERVALYGGRFDAGRRDTGGFAVRVLLPIR